MKLFFASYKIIAFGLVLMLLIGYQDLRSLTPDGSISRQDSSAAGISADNFSGQDEMVRFTDKREFNFYTTPFHSLSASIKGEVKFSEDYQNIIGISPGGYFIIKERRLFTTEMLEVTAGSDGKPHFRYRLRGRQFDYDEDARAWVRQVLPEVLERSGILAESRIRGHIANADVDAALDEISRLSSNHLKGEYYQMLAGYDALSDAEQVELVRAAGREIGSSSELRATLEHLVELLPDTPAINQELLHSAGEIASSSEKSRAIRTVAQSRAIDPQTAAVMAGISESISSSSEKSLALRSMAIHCRSEEAALSAYLEAAETISSSSERAQALEALIEAAPAFPAGWAKLASGAATISSSSEQSRVLRSMAKICPGAREVWEAYFSSAELINSSSEKAAALQAALTRDDFSGASLASAYPAIISVSSSSEKARVLSSAAAIVLPENAAMEAFLDAAATISSSSELERVLTDLLSREDLPRPALQAIGQFSENHLQSSSSRENVQRLLLQRMGEAGKE